MTSAKHHDTTLRFLFKDADIRGEWVLLGESLKSVNACHPYSSSVRQLLGQFAAAVVLISNNLKYSGKVMLQARSEGPISLIMLECTSRSEIRGIARGNCDATADQTLDLIPDAQLAITLERDGGQRYQGIVPLDGQSLARALDHYFLQSEQLNTRFWLFSDGNVAAGLMLQQLPAQRQIEADDRQNQWQNAAVIADTVTADELYHLLPKALLHRLYHQQDLRVFEHQPVVFRCACSRERSLNALSAFSAKEVNDMLAEQGGIDMACEMCGTSYKFTLTDLLGLAQNPVLH